MGAKRINVTSPTCHSILIEPVSFLEQAEKKSKQIKRRRVVRDEDKLWVANEGIFKSTSIITQLRGI